MIDPKAMPANLARAHARPATLRAPGAGGAVVDAPAVAAAPEPVKRKAGGLAKPRGRKGMNRTEAAYALILEAEKQAGVIRRWEREGITLRWRDGMTYTADFAVWSNDKRLAFIETKGAFLRDDALVKFRAARAHWPEFAFEMWQLKGGAWTQLL